MQRKKNPLDILALVLLWLLALRIVIIVIVKLRIFWQNMVPCKIAGASA